MNKKEKAKELVEKFRQQTGEQYSPYHNAKKCALIAVERTIDILKKLQESEHSDNFWFVEEAIQDEQELKEEIKQL